MIRSLRFVSLISGLVISAVALACAMLPMPPMIVDVSLADINAAQIRGYANPARAAALINLDGKASQLVGSAAWQQNNYFGAVTYRTSIAGINGVNIVTEDKPCDSQAIDEEESNRTTGGGGGSDTGGGTSSGGGGSSGVDILGRPIHTGYVYVDPIIVKDP